MGSEDEVDEHPHCMACVNSFCDMRPVDKISCGVIPCDQHCGVRFHTCKLSEHRKLCMNQRVSCINAENGCPVIMMRSQLGIHLETCPASVIHCTMEWNRWPVYSTERLTRVPFERNNHHAQDGQLDVALAQRDQRMLDEALCAPRKTRHVLRNKLTQRFPAVPLKPYTSTYSHAHSSNETSKTVSDEESDAPWEVRKNPPGLQSSVCKELYKAGKQALETRNSALSDVTEDVCVNPSFEQKVATLADQCSYPTSSAIDDHINDNVQSTGSVMEILYDFSDETQLQGTHGVCNQSHCTDRNTRSDSFSENSCSDKNSPKAISIPPPPESPRMNKVLGLDLNVESITRYQAKPKSMYTFLCAQNFRRDEYPWHLKNIHCDIHASLNGWLEQRCPLAHYGCSFSIRRFHPTQEGANVVHSSLLESFGIRPHIDKFYQSSDFEIENVINGPAVSPKSREQSVDIARDTDSYYLENQNDNREIELPNFESSDENVQPSFSEGFFQHLPFEILQHIARCLDSFSLCNLALTCVLLRDVCCSLLDERGVVVQQWGRFMQDGGQSKWRVVSKRWFFSTAFTPVEHWGYEAHPSISEHLKTCLYNKKSSPLEPFTTGLGMSHSDTFYVSMKRMYPDFTFQPICKEDHLQFSVHVAEEKKVRSRAERTGHDRGSAQHTWCSLVTSPW